MLYRVEGKNGQISEIPITTCLDLALGVCEIAPWSMTGVFDDPEVILVGQLSEYF